MGVKLPATGSGDQTPTVATEKLAGADFQLIKLVDGTPGGSQGVLVDSSGRLSVALAAASALVGASIANFPSVQPVSGYLGASVSNLPATQPVSGYLGASLAGGYAGASVAGGFLGASIANLPATQPVSGYLGASLAGGLAGASVSNFPATQAVSGYLGASLAGGYTGASLAGGYVGASLAGAASIAGGNITPAGGSTSATNIGGSVAALPAAAATGGATPFHYVAGASVNNVNVKASAGTLYSLTAISIASQARYIKLYDKASTPSVGQDTPIHTQIVPGAPSALVGNQSIVQFPVGLLFSNGLGFGTTLVYTDADKTAVGASDVILNLSFK